MTTISRAHTRARLLTSTVAVVVILVAPLIWKSRAEGSSSGLVGPIAVTEIPTYIPERGVDINTQGVLLPSRLTDVAGVDRGQALEAASEDASTGNPPTALLARVTVPGTIPPPDSPVPFRTIEDRLAWVITFTSGKPVVVGHSTPSAPDADLLKVTHYSVVLDAQTARFLIGFYTV